MSLRIGVVGGGFGGLAAACVLAARGHNVTLFDRNARVGGVASELETHFIRFDLGPTSLTAPRLLARIFEEAGRKLEDRLELTRLDPQLRCFFDDGSVLDLVEDSSVMAQRIAALTQSAAEGEAYRDFLVQAAKLQQARERLFFDRSITTLRDVIDAGLLQRSSLAHLVSLRLGQSVAEFVRGRVRDERVARLLESFTSGSSPARAPAMLCSSASVQSRDGLWHPTGGMQAVAASLEKLIRELGGQIHLSTLIAKIERDRGRATGLVTDGGDRFAFDAIVSNANSVRTDRDLLGGPGGDDEPSCSGLVLCFGLDQRYEHLAHHDIVFSRDGDEERRAIFEVGEPSADPTCYITAAEGGVALQVLVHMPYLRPHHDWREMLPACRRVILDKLARVAGMADLESRIVVERQVTPQDFHDRYGLLNGAIYGLASHGKFLGARKPGNRSRRVAGLYLAGGSAHPGAGVPMALLSGWLAAETLDRDARGGRLAV
ncbi:MAG: putative phytoene desaturase [Rhodospirillales bacterium]|nr:putative phytoene desaturase [Rhodospirillales bacterium]